jgi:hypothetical protein
VAAFEAFAASQFELAAPIEEDGEPLINHLLAIQERSGQTPQALLDAPVCPAGCEELWRVFSELHSCRGSTGFGPMRITYTDIDAFQRVSGTALQPWERDAIRSADAAYLNDYAERNKKAGK